MNPRSTFIKTVCVCSGTAPSSKAVLRPLTAPFCRVGFNGLHLLPSVGVIREANSTFPVQTIQFAGDWPHHGGNWAAAHFCGGRGCEGLVLAFELGVEPKDLEKVLQWKSDWDASGLCQREKTSQGPASSQPQPMLTWFGFYYDFMSPVVSWPSVTQCLKSDQLC